MASYKQTVLDIKDYISMENASIDHLLEKPETPEWKKRELWTEKETLKDIADIIKEDGK